MKQQKKRSYSREFKIDAVKMVVEKGMKQADVARDLGLSPQMFWRWVRQYRAKAREAFPGVGNGPERDHKDDQILELKKQLERVSMERDILKKAAAYFAQQST